MTKNRTAIVVAMTAALGFFSACSESKTSSPETVAPTDSVAPTTDPPTTPAPTTIAPTTLAPTTVPAPPAAFLRQDGLGPFDFGDSYADVLAGMPLVVTNDDGLSFAGDPGGRIFVSADGRTNFAYPHGRTVCWDDGVGGDLCATFGGADAATVTFVGWDYTSTAGVGVLFTDSGATINILLSDVPAMPAVDFECGIGYSQLELDGILLALQTPTNEAFGTYHDDGSYTLNVPAPAAWVSNLRVGQLVHSNTGEDC